MKLNAPKQITFLVAVILIVLGVLGYIVKIGFLVSWSFWLVVVGAVLLALGCFLKGL